MSGATDSGMVKTMGMVAGAVTLLALLCMMAARLLGVGVDDSDDPLKRNALIQRIEPVASVRTSLDDLPAGGALVADAGGAVKTGEELVNGACAACHVAGVAGAPMLGDEAAWGARRELGLDALVASVINGKGLMPARGGSAYSDDEIKTAVQHMALFEVEDSAQAPAETEVVAAADEAVAEAELVVAEETTEEAPAEADTAATTEVATDAPAAVEEVPAAEPEVAEKEAPAAADTVVVAAAPMVVGEVSEPEGVTDNIRNTVNGICAGCHLAGVAGAPKLDDVAAWQVRADKGLDALVASVTNGLNVMPARGGSVLTDEEIRIAVQYQISKVK